MYTCAARLGLRPMVLRLVWSTEYGKVRFWFVWVDRYVVPVLVFVFSARDTGETITHSVAVVMRPPWVCQFCLNL